MSPIQSLRRLWLLWGRASIASASKAYQSICADRISVFDQAKINSFIADRPAKQERMIMEKLQKGTFQAYKDLWKRLYAFSTAPAYLARRYLSSTNSPMTNYVDWIKPWCLPTSSCR
ncbi:hypothetical protein PSPO01_16236 [Paraphaeosphaeria sporulosa]